MFCLHIFVFLNLFCFTWDLLIDQTKQYVSYQSCFIADTKHLTFQELTTLDDQVQKRSYNVKLLNNVLGILLSLLNNMKAVLEEHTCTCSGKHYALLQLYLILVTLPVPRYAYKNTTSLSSSKISLSKHSCFGNFIFDLFYEELYLAFMSPNL